MKDYLKRIPKLLTLLFLSMSSVLISCGDNDEPGSNESSQSVSKVQVSYSVSLSDTWYKYFDVELSYTTTPGNTTVEVLDIDKVMSAIYNFSESPDKIELKIVAKPKSVRPEVEEGVTYPLNKKIYFNVEGVASDGSGYVFQFSEPRSSSMSSSGDAFRKSLDKEHILYSSSYTIPKQ